MSNQNLPRYITALLRPESYDYAVENVELIETHISWVLLTGTYAYKIKKPINPGFLDFSTLKKRHFYCQEELRLNTRLAPSLYLDVIPITGSEQQPVFSGSGRPFEYAVKMVQFPQSMQMDNLLADGQLHNKHIDALAEIIAEFHQHTDIADNNSAFGEPGKIYSPVRENVIQLQPLVKENIAKTMLAQLERWCQTNFKQLKPIFIQRKQDGFIRECHGDLHSGNLVFINDRPVAFDCIEFDPELRWIDTISDAAFLIMDLLYRQKPEFAWRFLNHYLEITGDYNAIQVLNFYLVYRAMVRAKVAAISASQLIDNSLKQQKASNACYHYLELAQACLQISRPILIISCGFSASGKSTLTKPLVEKLAAIRLRSDVERKRLFKDTEKTSDSAVFNAGIYTLEATQQTYKHLAEQAELILNTHYPVIIDATFLQYQQRELLHLLALKKNVPFIILHFKAQADTLRERIKLRKKDASDANLSVLEHQLVNWNPLQANEQSSVISVDTESPFDPDSLVNKIILYYEEHKI